MKHLDDMTPSARLMAEQTQPLPIHPKQSDTEASFEPPITEESNLDILNRADQTRSIVTLCLNPCMDIALDVSDFAMGELNRYQDLRTMPGGKGFNVARHLSHRNWENSIFITLPEINRGLQTVFDETDFGACVYRVPGSLRLNIKIHQKTEDGQTEMTEVNGSGDPIDPSIADELVQLLEHTVESSNVSVLAGSLLPGIPKRIYAKLLSVIKASNGLSVLDASGEQMIHAMETQAVDLFKPNRDELRELTGLPCLSHDEALDASLAICRHGQAQLVLCSLGEAGAILTNGHRHFKAIVPSNREIYNLMGAGDAMTAVLAMFASRCPLDQAFQDYVAQVDLGLLMREAMSTAQALVHREETTPPSPEEIRSYMHLIEVTELYRA